MKRDAENRAMIVRRTGGRDRGRGSARGVWRPLASVAIPCRLPSALRACGLPLPDPGGGFRDPTSKPNSAPRPAFRARRFRVREGARGGFRAVATPNRRAEAAGTAKSSGFSDSCAGLPGVRSGALRFGFVGDSSYYRLLSSPNLHIPAPCAAGHRLSERIAVGP